MKRVIFTSLAAFLALSSCTPIGAVVGAGATVGTAAMEERGFEGVVDDTKIQMRIGELWYAHDTALFAKVSNTVREGQALLTGRVEDPQMRVEAVRLAWQAEGVKKVINEIEVESGTDIVAYGTDMWIRTKLWTTLTFDEQVDSINYSVDVVAGSVYVMGIARDDQELERVLGHARSVKSVKRVVSLVREIGRAHV